VARIEPPSALTPPAHRPRSEAGHRHRSRSAGPPAVESPRQGGSHQPHTPPPALRLGGTARLPTSSLSRRPSRRPALSGENAPAPVVSPHAVPPSPCDHRWLPVESSQSPETGFGRRCSYPPAMDFPRGAPADHTPGAPSCGEWLDGRRDVMAKGGAAGSVAERAPGHRRSAATQQGLQVTPMQASARPTGCRSLVSRETASLWDGANPGNGNWRCRPQLFGRATGTRLPVGLRCRVPARAVPWRPTVLLRLGLRRRAMTPRTTPASSNLCVRPGPEVANSD
jgi:hypothetical protein